MGLCIYIVYEEAPTLCCPLIAEALVGERGFYKCGKIKQPFLESHRPSRKRSRVKNFSSIALVDSPMYSKIKDEPDYPR